MPADFTHGFTGAFCHVVNKIAQGNNLNIAVCVQRLKLMHYTAIA